MTKSKAYNYQVEMLPDGWIAIWRTSLDNKTVYSVTEFLPKSGPLEPEPTDPLILLRQALAS